MSMQRPEEPRSEKCESFVHCYSIFVRSNTTETIGIEQIMDSTGTHTSLFVPDVLPKKPTP